MRFSLKSLILISTWFAWCFGALVAGQPWVILSFTFCQYLLLAISVSLVCSPGHKNRMFAICFVAGFSSWLLFLWLEPVFAGTQSIRLSIQGSRIDALTQWISDFAPYGDAKNQVKHYKDIGAFLRATFGTAFGVLTYLGTLLLYSKSNQDKDAEI